jgi:hypothetical protein
MLFVTDSRKEPTGNEILILAEHPVAARATLSAARSPGAAHCLGFRTAAEMLATPFGNRARPAADQPLNAAAALRTRLKWSLRHFLPPLKTASARIAKIVIGWHQTPLQ